MLMLLLTEMKLTPIVIFIMLAAVRKLPEVRMLLFLASKLFSRVVSGVGSWGFDFYNKGISSSSWFLLLIILKFENFNCNLRILIVIKFFYL